MKKIILFIALSISFLHGVEPEVVLLTYPRSGANWLMYCVTKLTNRGWSHKQGEISYTPGNISYDRAKKRYHQTHYWHAIAKHIDSDSDYLMMIVRNPKECITRHNGSLESGIKNFNNWRYFLQNLELFDSWSEEKRLLVYYEDLMRNPKAELQRVLEFLGEYKINAFETFIRNLPKHQRFVLSYYDRQRGGSKSRGKDLLYHSKSALDEVQKEFDALIKEQYPIIWDKYLWMYETP